MGRDLYDRFDSAKAVFKQADEVLGFPVSQLCFNGPDDELRQTINVQPAIVTVTLALLSAIHDIKGENSFLDPTFIAGHSLGEYTALNAAGVLDLATTIYLTHERGRLMHQAGLKELGGMVAVIGLDESLLAEVCTQTGTLIANVNCPGQLVISGAKDRLAKATELAEAKGAYRTIPLAVSGAFHTPLMQPAVEGLAEIITNISFAEPLIPIIANTTAQPITNAKLVKEELLKQLCHSVQWQRTIEYMIDNGVSTFIEIGPGRVLSSLIKRINKNVKAINIGDAEAIKNLVN